MGTPQAAVGYRLQLGATYRMVRVRVGVASLIVVTAIAAIGSMEGRWVAAVVVAVDLIVNILESRRPQPRAVISLVSLATMFGLLGIIIRVPALIGSSLVFIIVAATVIAELRQAVAIVVYSVAWAIAGLLMLREYGLPDSVTVPSFLADVISIAAFGAATFVLIVALTRRLDLFDQLRTGLISSVTHELRSPLTGLHGLATVLQDNFDDLSRPEINEVVDLLVLESAEANTLVEDLLTAVQPTERIRMNRTVVDVAREVAAVVAMLGPVMSKPIVVVDGQELQAFADPTRLRQVIRNLLTNAERYGGPQVEIRLEKALGTAVITVCDNGPGIPPDEREAVFEEWQSSDRGSQHPESIGLGLTISRRLARAMDGDLTYRYHNGESLFSITLPVEAPRVVAPSI
ncbi:MAG: HAMP domain-containing histidine kinase [Acidimicrobiia bacterium]|nr:HAMP domain-containing histidine kinase [Acidimicrobiia bacterium]